MYAGVAIFFLLLAVIVSILPGPFGDNPDKHSGYYLLPWSVGAGFLGLLFSIPFTRHETDEQYQRAVLTGQLVVGALLAVGSVTAGIFNPDFLVALALCWPYWEWRFCVRTWGRSILPTASATRLLSLLESLGEPLWSMR